MCHNLHRFALFIRCHARLWSIVETQKKSDGRRIMNAPLVAALLEAILLPVKIAICKCAAHTTNRDFVSTGNARADMAAKDTAAKQTKHTECTLLSETDKHISSSLQGMQAFASGAEKNKWKKCGCRMTGGVWISSDGKPCLPRHFFPHYAKSIHGKDHVSKGGMVTQMKELWFTKGFTTFAEKFCKRCVICNTHNEAKGIKMSQVSQPTPIGPFFFFSFFLFYLLSSNKITRGSRDASNGVAVSTTNVDATRHAKETN